MKTSPTQAPSIIINGESARAYVPATASCQSGEATMNLKQPRPQANKLQPILETPVLQPSQLTAMDAAKEKEFPGSDSLDG